jgi:pimeloyl-ACP methyl ester carboxylesterase
MNGAVSINSNGVALAVTTWGARTKPPLLLIHGWGDSGRSFKSVADELSNDYFVVAPDLRGFGDSDWAAHGYWFPDYLVDIEVIANTFFDATPFVLVGHSMGGNVAGLYAGIRPARIRRLVLLEGFGLPQTEPSQAPRRYRRWLDEIATARTLRDFASFDALCSHLTRLAPRAAPEVIEWIAACWATPLASGQWRLKMDPKHKLINPVLYRREEATACWQATTAPVLLIAARESDIATRFPRVDILTNTAQHYPHAQHAWVDNAGHMLHWEQPLVVASLIREFIADTR